MHRVRLINRIANQGRQLIAVCGISTKTYGQAALIPAFNGFVFEMSLEDYDRDKFDIVGNPNFQQQWVPEFVPVVEALPVGDQEHAAMCAAATEESARPKLPRKEKSLKQRAQDAGVYKKGMTEDQMKEALGFPD